MNEVLTTVFTAIVALATCIYTYFTIKLWRATQASVDTAKATVMLNYLMALAQEAARMKDTDPQSAAVLEHLLMILMESTLATLLDDVDMNKQRQLRDTLNRIDGLFQTQGVDMRSIPFLRPIAEKMKGKR